MAEQQTRIKNSIQYRVFSGLEMNESENKLTLRGTPIVFDKKTVLWEYDGIKFYEVIDRNALIGADMNDFVFNYNHGGRVYARTRNGTITYQITERGLDCEITLDGGDEGHRQLYRDVKNKLIDKMSFSFRISEEKYNKTTRTFTVTGIERLYDVSAVDFAAYDDTYIAARKRDTTTSWFELEYNREKAELEAQRRKLILKTYL